jgi:hypothetical protein
VADKKNCRLVQNKKRVMKNVTFRRKYIASLEIPCHEKFGHFIYMDVLLCMARQVVEQAYIKSSIAENKEVVSDDKMKEIGKVLEAPKPKEDPKVEFRKAVLGISKLNQKIASVDALIKIAKGMSKKGGIKNIDVKERDEEQEIYSSKHYIYGELIVKCWRDFMSAKALEIGENEKNRIRSLVNSDEGELEEKSKDLKLIDQSPQAPKE